MREIRKLDNGKWRCTLLVPQGCRTIQPVDVKSPVTARSWLEKKRRLRFLDPGRTRKEHNLIAALRARIPMSPDKRFLAKLRIAREETDLFSEAQMKAFAKAAARRKWKKAFRRSRTRGASRHRGARRSG